MTILLTRRTALLAGAAASATVAMPWIARAAPEFSLKYANNVPVTHPLNVRAKEAMDRIKAQTNGRGYADLTARNAVRRLRHALYQQSVQLGAGDLLLGQKQNVVELFVERIEVVSALTSFGDGRGGWWEHFDNAVWYAGQ